MFYSDEVFDKNELKYPMTLTVAIFTEQSLFSTQIYTLCMGGGGGGQQYFNFTRLKQISFFTRLKQYNIWGTYGIRLILFGPIYCSNDKTKCCIWFFLILSEFKYRFFPRVLILSLLIAKNVVLTGVHRGPRQAFYTGVKFVVLAQHPVVLF